jgi:hypothetical protein
LGIGTTAPNSILQIEENAANAEGAELRVINDSSAVGSGQTATLTLGRDFDERNFKIKSVSTDSYGLRPDLVFTSNQGTGTTHTEAMRITNTGNVGIGTSSPVNELEVYGSSSPRISIRAPESITELIDLGFQFGTGANSSSNTLALIRAIPTQVDPSALKSNLAFFTNSGDSANEAMRIDEFGNVGIGTTNPNTVLHVKNLSGNNGIRIETAATDNGFLHFADSNDDNIGRVVYSHSDNSMQFVTNDAEAMRIDSSGNLLVGTTSSTLYNGTSGTGFSYRAGNELTVARSGASVATFVRQSDDGDILSLKKDGSAVGSIGVSNSGTDLVIDATRFSNRAGLRFRDSSLYPRQNATDADGLIDLGGPTAKFKNLYLSGGVQQSPVTVSNLPAAASSTGYRYMVSDSTVAASGNFGATVAGSGSNVVPVFSDGTNWLIG